MEYSSVILNLQDFIERSEDKEYLEIRKNLIQDLYKNLASKSTRNFKISKKEGVPYIDSADTLWIPVKIKKRFKTKNGFLSIFKNGTEIKILDKDMYEELPLKGDTQQLKISSFYKLVLQKDELKELTEFPAYVQNEECVSEIVFPPQSQERNVYSYKEISELYKKYEYLQSLNNYGNIIIKAEKNSNYPRPKKLLGCNIV